MIDSPPNKPPINTMLNTDFRNIRKIFYYKDIDYYPRHSNAIFAFNKAGKFFFIIYQPFAFLRIGIACSFIFVLIDLEDNK